MSPLATRFQGLTGFAQFVCFAGDPCRKLATSVWDHPPAHFGFAAILGHLVHDPTDCSGRNGQLHWPCSFIAVLLVSGIFSQARMKRQPPPPAHVKRNRRYRHVPYGLPLLC